jgi:hypothetical protein
MFKMVIETLKVEKKKKMLKFGVASTPTLL